VHGIIQRPSEDVDLFTDQGDPVQFRRALDTAVQAWSAEVRTLDELANTLTGDPKQ
jgi:Nucleotidyl transferase AbiEii toxin, Type IV TA system